MSPRMLPIEALPDADLREEWEHFRGFGWADERIASRLELEWSTVSGWVHQYRERGRPVRASAKKRRERVADLIRKGLSARDVAAELGVSRHTVHDDCCRLGLTRRPA